MSEARPIDLRSDTVTRPTARMRKAMYEAEVGDDVLQEDPNVNALEQEAAERVGKEASLLVPSGTFANQLALFTHCSRGAEAILSDESHIVQHEAGAAAIIAGVQLRCLHPREGYPQWGEIEPLIRKEQNIHYPPTGLIALENALSNGEVLPLPELEQIHHGSRLHHVPVHMDGARIFNAALALGVQASKLAGCTDSLMFCLSKGLCAPVGSMLAGTRQFIAEARRKRKIMGGGMRQAGILAAAGRVALCEMIDRLAEDHEKARLLAECFLSTGLFEVRPRPVKVNMFFVRFLEDRLKGKERALAEKLAEGGVLTYPPEDGWLRFVTHHDVSFEDIRTACLQVQRAASQFGA